MDHEKLVEEAKEAIRAVANDMDVSLEQCIESLEELQEEIGPAIDGLKSDIAERGRE